jgi:hypothetical protein
MGFQLHTEEQDARLLLGELLRLLKRHMAGDPRTHTPPLGEILGDFYANQFTQDIEHHYNLKLAATHFLPDISAPLLYRMRNPSTASLPLTTNTFADFLETVYSALEAASEADAVREVDSKSVAEWAQTLQQEAAKLVEHSASRHHYR